MIVQGAGNGLLFDYCSFVRGREPPHSLQTMIAHHATADDFSRWESKARSMTDAELLYSARDCRQAEVAMRGWNPVAEGRYSDEAHTYGDELRRRRAA